MVRLSKIFLKLEKIWKCCFLDLHYFLESFPFFARCAQSDISQILPNLFLDLCWLLLSRNHIINISLVNGRDCAIREVITCSLDFPICALGPVHLLFDFNWRRYFTSGKKGHGSHQRNFSGSLVAVVRKVNSDEYNFAYPRRVL